MRILLTGASGLIGSALAASLTQHNHQVVPMLRCENHPLGTAASWNPGAGRVTLTDTGILDAVVHLAAENVGQRWTKKRKLRIRESRVTGTRLLSEALTRLSQPPKVLISASAVGFYGNRADDWVDEDSRPGQGFLAELCQDWEASTIVARDFGIRVVCLRLGIVLSRAGGALARLLPAFKSGLGGKLGDGSQYWSWIGLRDVLGIIDHALLDVGMSGGVNAVTANPVTNLEFARTLGRVLRRPAIVGVPRVIVESLFGEMGREALLASARVKPTRLQLAGYQFQQPNLESALRQILGFPNN